MRLYVRYTLIIIILSYLTLRLVTHPTSIQRQPDNSQQAYFQSRMGEPLNADEQRIDFYPEDAVIVYNAAWNSRIAYTVQCELAHNMALDCESVIHYGIVSVPSAERYVFHWDE